MSEAIREAASVIAGRDGPAGLEILVLERGASSRFLPGYVAFPGGSVEPGDAETAMRWFGSAEEAARACALRELVEEVGLALSANGLEEAPARSFTPVDDAPPSTGQLVEIAHWVAPPEVPVRFDARFFAIAAPPGLELRPDGGETAAAWWLSPRVLLEDWEAGRRRLYWPTFFTVSALAPCASVAGLLALRIETREPEDDEVERLPRSTFWQDAS